MNWETTEKFTRVNVGDHFRYGDEETRDLSMQGLEHLGIKCLAYNSNDEFCFRVIETPTQMGRPEDLREWYDESGDEPLEMEDA